MDSLFWLILVIGVVVVYILWQIHNTLIYISRQLRDWNIQFPQSIHARNDPHDPHIPPVGIPNSN